MIRITWLGCAAYILDLDGTRLMFDPFFYRQKNEKTNPTLKTKREDVKDISGIFITHAHFDHISDAGWFAEYRNVPVYGSRIAKKNIIKWAEGKIFEDSGHELTEKGIANLLVVEAEDIIKINDNVSVEVIKSAHILFDKETIDARTKNKEFTKQMRTLAPLFKELPKGKVFAYCVHYKNKKIIAYGSLWEKFKDILKKFENCEIFIPPLAGNSALNIAKKGGTMVDILKPKVVIPTHWDDFWPPVSRFEDLGPFHDYMKKNHPDVKIINLEIDEEIIIK
jgi:L-ascorbate metabolism protein UlaG (beta-lactamase superfamily)